MGTNTILFDASDLADGTAAFDHRQTRAGRLDQSLQRHEPRGLQIGQPAASGMLARFDDTTTTYASVRGYRDDDRHQHRGRGFPDDDATGAFILGEVE